MLDANRSSYTAASSFPAKLFCDNDILDMTRNHAIRPVHVQINPTNKCPLNCSFCSVKKRDKSIEMSHNNLKDISNNFINLGMKALTITGGGDPLSFPVLAEYVQQMAMRDIRVSLVTNGILFKLHNLNFIDNLSWCRISISDERALYPEELEEALKHKTDWSFSYVITKGNIPMIAHAINFANDHDFTHVRLVDDILGEESHIERIRENVERRVDCSRVIWQGRKTYTRGHKRCLISLLKPNIDPMGNMTPCCGVQYAAKKPDLNFSKAFTMCGPKMITETYESQIYFDGSVCERCYYSEYNNALNAFWDADKLKHKEFA